VARKPRRPSRAGASRVGARDTARRRAENRRAAIIFALSVVAVGGLGAVAFVNRAPALDEGNGCVRGELVPPAHTMVLVDQTDSLGQRQIDYVKTLILLEYDRLKPGERLTVRPIDENPDSNAREFSRCRVRRGADVLGLGANPEMIEADFRRIVGNPLNNYLNSLADAPTAEASPILETIATAIDSPDFGENVAERRLIVVSDMAQHSPLADQYGQPESYDLSPEARDLLRRDLKAVAVRVHYVRRPSLLGLQNEAHRTFWRDWLKTEGADVELGWGLQMVDKPVEDAAKG
jgi:hypothetical protein